jgi:DNA-binding LacI/PurR family transcriptional regulator
MEKKPLIREKVAHELRQYVNQMRSNTQIRIPSERELSDYFKVSRITLRAAVSELVREGMLVQVKGKGTYITPRSFIRQLHMICSPKIKNNDPFYMKFLSELTSMASKQSVNLLFIGLDQIEKATEDIPLVIIGLFEDNNILDKLISCYKAIIAIQDYNNYNDVISQIYFNDYKIGWQAGQLLTAYGHKKVLLLAGPEKYPSAYYRKKGFIDAMKRLDLYPLVHTEKMNWAGGYLSGDYIFNELTLKERPSAVFATNDWMAIGLMQKLKENGVKIPEDISVAGCDDIPFAGEFVPALTTFNLDMKYLVLELFSILGELLSAKEEMTRKIVLPGTLVLRDSLKKLI